MGATGQPVESPVVASGPRRAGGRRRAGAALVLAAAVAILPGCRAPGAGSSRIRVLAPYLPDAIDPCEDTRLVSRVVAVNVFDPLVRADRTGAPYPALAASWSNPTADAWTFTLRKDARFSDGTPVTASDVVASLERARALGSAVAGNLAGVRQVRADGPGTVTILAGAGSAVLLQTLTAVLVARELPAAEGGRRFVGSGPYTVTRFVPGTRIEMKAAPGGTGPPPHLAEVVWERFSSDEGAREALRADPRTIVLDPPEAAVTWARRQAGLAVAREFSGALAYLAFGLSPAGDGAPRPFADRRRREAVRLALDVPELLDEMGPAGGYPATQVIPSGVFGFDPSDPVLRRDLAAARALLREAGVPAGEVPLDATPQGARLARALTRQLGEIGLSTRVEELPPAQFRERIEGRSDLFVFNWVVGPEAGEALKNFFHTKDPARRLGMRNRTGFSDPAFDAAIEKALEASQPTVQLPLLHAAIRVLDREVPWIPLFTIRSVRIHPADLAVPFRSDGMLLLADVSPASGRPRT